MAGIGLILPALAAGQLPDQPAVAPTIAAVNIEGLERISESYARSLIRTRPGDAFDRAAVDADVARLLRSGKFLSANAVTDASDGRMTVTFQVSERPTLAAVRFVGNTAFKETELLDKLPFKTGEPIDLFSVREGREAILAAYREKGFGNAVIEFDDVALRESAEVVYTIEEGPKVRVRQILFEGNQAFPPEELTKHIHTQTYLWIFRDGKFDVDQVESDAAGIQAFYRGEGFLDARVSYRLNFSPDRTDLTIVFTIDEGTRYAVDNVRFEGNTLYTDDELLAMVSLLPGNWMLQRRLEADARAIQTRYGERGYIYAEVRPTRVFAEEPGLVNITIAIEEGEAYSVGRVVPRGNAHTQDKVVRRALELFPGDTFNATAMREAERRLVETRIFSSANIVAVGEQPETRDIVINVEESEKAGDLIFGLGVTSNNGLVGSVVLDVQNFDLFDFPRTFSEFIKLRSFRGAGQRLRLEAQPGTELSRFRIDFTEPYLLDKPLVFGASAYYFQRGRDDYDEQRVGTTLSLGKRIKTGPLKNWFGEIALRAEGVEIDGLNIFSARDIRDAEGSHFLTSVKGTMVLDRTDNRLIPTRGDRWRFSYEQTLVEGDTFGRIGGEYQWHRTMYTDLEDRKSVLSLKAEAGYIVGDAPVYERFYAGGIGSMRGFEFRGVSPRQGLRDDGIGGHFIFLTGAEYSFPLYADTLRGVAFVDMGTVEEDFGLTTWRAAVGFGIRLQIDFFGPIPLEFAFAAPISSDDDDEEEVFSFFIGTTF